MSEGSSRGFLLSITIHGIVAGLMFISFVLNRDVTDIPKVFQLVAGEGDNYMAQVAPALGTPGGVKIDLPKAPEPKPAPPEPAPQEIVTAPPATPKVVAPAPPTKQPDTTVPDFKKKIRRDVIVAESKAKREIKKQRDADLKKQRDAEAKAAEDQKRMTKDEFDRANKSKAAPSTAKSAPPKVARIDAEGIAKGVVGGSTANKIGGAGGKALTAEEGDEADRYFAALLQRLKEALDRTPGLEDGLRAEAEFYIGDDGRLSRARIAKTSRNDAFDRAVLEAIASIRMGPRPRAVSPKQVVPFSTHNRDRG